MQGGINIHSKTYPCLGTRERVTEVRVCGYTCPLCGICPIYVHTGTRERVPSNWGPRLWLPHKKSISLFRCPKIKTTTLLKKLLIYPYTLLYVPLNPTLYTLKPASYTLKIHPQNPLYIPLKPTLHTGCTAKEKHLPLKVHKTYFKTTLYTSNPSSNTLKPLFTYP